MLPANQLIFGDIRVVLRMPQRDRSGNLEAALVGDTDGIEARHRRIDHHLLHIVPEVVPLGGRDCRIGGVENPRQQGAAVGGDVPQIEIVDQPQGGIVRYREIVYDGNAFL